MKNYERLEKEVRNRLFAFIDKFGNVTNYTYSKVQVRGQTNIITLKEGRRPILRVSNYTPYAQNSLFQHISPFGLDLPAKR